jgi:hypothetical protein
MTYSAGDAYVMLMASLPPIGKLFAPVQPPISRLRLDQRLAMLTELDRQRLDRIEAITLWSRVASLGSDAAVARAARLLDQELPEVLARVVQHRLELRTLVAALRVRAAGAESAANPSEWGVGRWNQTIARHWSEKDFRLGHVYPWLDEAEALVAAGDALSLEQLLLTEAWRSLDSVTGHYFDFVAVVVYVLRWDIAERWHRCDEELAASRFASMVEAGLGEHGRRLPLEAAQ